jgi:hypothetical protein
MISQTIVLSTLVLYLLLIRPGPRVPAVYAGTGTLLLLLFEKTFCLLPFVWQSLTHKLLALSCFLLRNLYLKPFFRRNRFKDLGGRVRVAKTSLSLFICVYLYFVSLREMRREPESRVPEG